MENPERTILGPITPVVRPSAPVLTPEDIIEWIEPYADYWPEVVTMRMTASDVAAVRRRQEPRYESDQEAIDDFMIVHWATRKAVS